MTAVNLSIAFLEYLRVGEIAMPNMNSNHIVKISDVAFDSKAEIRVLLVLHLLVIVN